MVFLISSLQEDMQERDKKINLKMWKNKAKSQKDLIKLLEEGKEYEPLGIELSLIPFGKQIDTDVMSIRNYRDFNWVIYSFQYMENGRYRFLGSEKVEDEEVN